MASKSHVQDNSVAERRLRPIYEWLDTGNNKKALQECDKVLKKTPNLHCAKALKALSFLRMGKDVDCNRILESLIQENPAEDATLQAITLCYRELQQQEKICTLYENAVKVDPTNEEFQSHLFMSYVRIGDFKSQQKVAMNLYKLKPKNPYYCWAVMSVIQQANRGQNKTEPSKSTILLTLAERMIHKLISENKLEAEQEVQLYLMILEQLNKYDEALQVFNGVLGEKLVCTTPGMYKLDYLIKLNKWAEVNLLCKEILTENVDNWNIWKEYMNSVFKLFSNGSQLNNHVDNHNNVDNYLQHVDDTPEKAHEFICGVLENGVGNGYQLRGPYLARFELCSKLVKVGIESIDLLGEKIELFIEYFRKFGHKSCCVSDLRIYLNLLDLNQRADLSCRLIKDVGISSTSVPQNLQQMQRHICSLQLSRLCGSHRNLSADHLAALVTAFSLHYQHGYQTYGLNLLSTDQGPSDAYAILAAHILYDLAQLTNSSKPIITALVLLENLLKNSPHCFNAKLLCVRMYHAIGAGIGANKMYDSLDIKHLQIDSLGYIHCARLPTTGLISLTSTLLDITSKFFSSNYKDSSDHLTFCYKFGSFIKLDDFMDFREKLVHSFHYAMATIDRSILNLLQNTSSESLYTTALLPKEDMINWEKNNNEDLSVYLSWDPERIEGLPEDSNEAQTLFQQNVQLFKLRVNILTTLTTAINIVKSRNVSKDNLIDTLKQNLKDWEDLYNKINSTKTDPINENLVTLPLPSRLHSHLTSPYLDILQPMFTIFHNTVVEDAENSTLILIKLKEKFECLLNTVKLSIYEQNKSDDCYWRRRAVMEDIVNSVEILSISSVIISLCFDLTKQSQGKKAKKKADPALKCILNDLSGITKDVINEVDSSLDVWNSLQEFDLSDRLALLNLNADGQKSVFEDIENSHITAVKELKAVLKSKFKLLNNGNS